MPMIRGGFCMYHQPEEVKRRVLDKLVKNQNQRSVLMRELMRINAA